MENELILLRMGPYFLVEDCSFYSLGGRFLSNYSKNVFPTNDVEEKGFFWVGA